MVVSINVTGKTAALAFLGKGFKDIKLGVTEGMTRVGLLMTNEVKSSIAGRQAEPTSVDTGRLLNSIEFTASPSNVSIFTFVPYANFIEFATSITGGPRRHFTNSLNRNKQRIAEILQREVNLSVG